MPPIDPKLIATVASVLVWLVGKFGLHADTVDVAPVVGALWVYVAAHAHAASGGGDQSSSGSTPAAGTLASTIMKVGVVALAIACASLSPLALGCGASQATATHDVVCVASDVDAIAKILDNPALNGYGKLAALAQQAALTKACIDASTSPKGSTTMIELHPAAASHLHDHEIDRVLEDLAPNVPVTVQAGTVAICEDTGHVLLHTSDAAPRIIGSVPEFMSTPLTTPVPSDVHDRVDDLMDRLRAWTGAHNEREGRLVERIAHLEAAYLELVGRLDALVRISHVHDPVVA